MKGDVKMNEVSTQNQFSLSLQTALEESRDALPADFNIARFVQNSIALLNGNDSLIEFGKKYGTAQIKATFNVTGPKVQVELRNVKVTAE